MSSVNNEILELRLSKGKEMVEGDWKQFHFKMITPSDYPEVFACLRRNFYNSTPLTKGLEYSQEYYDEFDKLYLEYFPHNLSFYARDTINKEIVGLRVIYIHDCVTEDKFSSLEWKTNEMKNMMGIMAAANEKANIYGHFGITQYVNFTSACVDSRHRDQGLATEMYERALSFVGSFPNFKHVKSNSTSPYTRRIYQKLGFKELARIYFNDFKDADGLQLLNGFSDNDFVSCIVRKL